MNCEEQDQLHFKLQAHMHLPKRQHPLDWLTQLWNIALGRKIEPTTDSWLDGPIGKAEESPQAFIERYSKEFEIRTTDGYGDVGLLSPSDLNGLNLAPLVFDFYTRTSAYQLDVEAHWRKGLSFLGCWGARFFTRRIMQFQLPDLRNGGRQQFSSEITELASQIDGVRCALWTRSDKTSGEMIFYGIYSTCTLEGDAKAVKTVFPLPEGSATVTFDISVDDSGSLELTSRGSKSGDSGFYFIVEDAEYCRWKHLVRFLKQTIVVYPDSETSLRAEHRFSIFNLEIYRIDYFIQQSEPRHANIQLSSSSNADSDNFESTD